MLNHSFGVRRAITGVLAGAIVAGALAGPAMASGGDDGSVRKAGEKPVEYLITPRKAGDKTPDYSMRKAGGDPSGHIILI